MWPWLNETHAAPIILDPFEDKSMQGCLIEFKPSKGLITTCWPWLCLLKWLHLNYNFMTAHLSGLFMPLFLSLWYWITFHSTCNLISECSPASSLWPSFSVQNTCLQNPFSSTLYGSISVLSVNSMSSSGVLYSSTAPHPKSLSGEAGDVLIASGVLYMFICCVSIQGDSYLFLTWILISIIFALGYHLRSLIYNARPSSVLQGNFISKQSHI